MKKKLVFLGVGSYVDVIVLVIDFFVYDFVGFFDDKDIMEYDGYFVFGKFYDVLFYFEDGLIDVVFIIIGDNVKRKELFEYVVKDYYDFIINIISFNVLVLILDSICGCGIFIGFGVFIGFKVKLFDNNVVNIGVFIEYYIVVELYCNIVFNVIINGFCYIREEVYVGSVSVII